MSPVLASFTLGQDQLTDNDNDGIDDDAIGWRWFVILCALPCLLSVLVGLAHVPEFPRWLCLQGRYEQALAVLRQAAVHNGKDPMGLFPLGIHLDSWDNGDHSSYSDLYTPRWRKTTILLWITLIGLAFTSSNRRCRYIGLFERTSPAKDERQGW